VLASPTQCAQSFVGLLPQSFPQYLQQYDASFRGSDPLLGQPSFGTSAQTSAAVLSQQQSFISQVHAAATKGDLGPGSA
jgi:hypothetical protein